jgi:Glu-tRNA(Gln) amidotransferase subunit E-like FAD-binding protein
MSAAQDKFARDYREASRKLMKKYQQKAQRMQQAGAMTQETALKLVDEMNSEIMNAAIAKVVDPEIRAKMLAMSNCDVVMGLGTVTFVPRPQTH